MNTSSNVEKRDDRKISPVMKDVVHAGADAGGDAPKSKLNGGEHPEFPPLGTPIIGARKTIATAVKSPPPVCPIPIGRPVALSPLQERSRLVCELPTQTR